MRNRILVVLLAVVITGCVNESAEQALQDSITQNLVEQSIKPYNLLNHDGLYNSCNFFSRPFYCTRCNNLGGPYGCEEDCSRPQSCDALDLRLKNQGVYPFGSSSLVSYAMDQSEVAQKTHDDQQREQNIENMANGK